MEDILLEKNNTLPPEVVERAAKESRSNEPTLKVPKKRRKWPLRLGIVVVLLGLLWFFLIRPMVGAGQQMLAAAYLSDSAKMQEMTVAVSSTGTVTPIDSYRVSSLVLGEVVEAPFEEGEWVEKGALMYRFDAEDAENALARSRLSVQQAELGYRTALDSVQPAATGSGTVQKLHVKVGDTISPGSVIAEIADSALMTVEIPFHASDATNLSAGQSAVITLEGNLETLPATIQSISGAEEIGPGNVRLRQVKFQVANPGALAAGTSATAMVGGTACAGSGLFQQNLQQVVTAKSGGEISQLYVSEGDAVSYGKVLCTIGGLSAETSLENARISQQSALLSLETAERALENYVITAPISGEVIEKNFKAGDKVETNNLTAVGGCLAVLYDMSTLTFEMKIDELDINKIALGQEVTITADGVEGAAFTGYVDKINISGTTVGGVTTYPITVVIRDPEGLKPGMNVSADVIVEEAGVVLAIPVEAVTRGSGMPTIQVAPAGAFDENGMLRDITQVEQREVTLGRNDSKFIEITSGLNEGEIVVWQNQTANLFAMMAG